MRQRSRTVQPRQLESSKLTTSGRYLSIRPFILICLIVVASLTANAQKACRELFTRDFETQTLKWDGKTATAVALKRYGILRTDSLPKRFQNDLIIGLKNDHTFVSYRGVRIDANGIPGVGMRALIRRNDSLDAQLLAVIRIEPERAQELMEQFAIEFVGSKQKALTCSAMSCTIIRTASPEVLTSGLYLTPSALLSGLMKAATDGSDRVTIVTLNGMTPQKLIGRQRTSQTIRMALMPLLPLLPFL
jgi:hypothetical protein